MRAVWRTDADYEVMRRRPHSHCSTGDQEYELVAALELCAK